VSDLKTLERCPWCGGQIDRDGITRRSGRTDDPRRRWDRLPQQGDKGPNRFITDWLEKAEQDPERNRKRGLVITARLLGMASYLLTALGVASFLAGPFTCFVSWRWALNLFLWGAPVHGLALLAQTGALKAIRGDYRWFGQSVEIATGKRMSGVGLLLAAVTVALAAWYGLWPLVVFWR
jgi:hypothetical protein